MRPYTAEEAAALRAVAPAWTGPTRIDDMPVMEMAADADAVWRCACPRCGARLGQYCKTPDGTSHRGRSSGVPRVGGYAPGSVRAVSGGAFETNRRRH